MKRIILGFGVLILIALFAAFFVLGGQRRVGSVVQVKVNYSLALRSLPDTAQWNSWWPWHASQNGLNAIEGNLAVYSIGDARMDAYWVEGKDSLPLTISILPKGNDSTLLVWEGQINPGINPIARIKAFASQKRVTNFMQTLLRSYGLYASDSKNLYGIDPEITMVTDTILITTKVKTAKYPTTAEIYQSIDKLEKYAAAQKTPANGLPMYHIENINGSFEMMVGLPVQKELPQTDQIRKKLLIPGRLLKAEVTAGPQQLPLFFRQLELYREDFGLMSPAIPFFQIVTNRMVETDTSKWVTRLCYPIF